MRRAILAALTITLVAALAPVTAGAGDPHQSGGRAVFLDPAFGGKISGPVLEGKTAAKQITLDIAKDVYRELRNHEISVHLSRSRDVTVSVEDRLVKARKTGGELYVSIRVGRDSRNCVQVSVPAFPAPAPDDNTDDYLMNILWENLQNQSRDLAQIVSQSMKGKNVALCGDVSVQNDTALEKAMLPTIIVDWETGGKAAAGSAPVDVALQKAIASALAEGIREYSASSAGGDQRQR